MFASTTFPVKFFLLLLIINMLVIGLNKPEWNKLLLLDIEAWLKVSLIIVLYTVTMEICLWVLIWHDWCMNFRILWKLAWVQAGLRARLGPKQMQCWAYGNGSMTDLNRQRVAGSGRDRGQLSELKNSSQARGWRGSLQLLLMQLLP